MITDFIAAVKKGMARTNRFTVEISADQSDDAKLITLFCESVSLPGINIATTPHRVYGETREMAYERGFDPVNMTFYVDSNLQVKQFFDAWMGNIVDPFTRQMNYYKNYVKDIKISVYTVDETVAPYELTLYEAYPKTIGTVQLDNNSKDIMKLPVTFAYKYWRTEQITLSKPGLYTTEDPQSFFTAEGFSTENYTSEMFQNPMGDNFSDFIMNSYE